MTSRELPYEPELYQELEKVRDQEPCYPHELWYNGKDEVVKRLTLYGYIQPENWGIGKRKCRITAMGRRWLRDNSPRHLGVKHV